MNTDSYFTAINDHITKQKKDMQGNLHTVGKFIYDIHEKSVKLSKCLPNVFQHLGLGDGVSFRNNDFSYTVGLRLNQYVVLTYKGEYNFTYREIKREDENSNWEICLSDLDDKVTAVDIYSTVWNLLEWLNNYSSQNEERIKAIIERLENM